MPQATAPPTPKAPEVPFTAEEWELDTTITHSPRPIPEACDSSDGCDPSCASSCTSS
jgi:FxLD family lantipeptide